MTKETTAPDWSYWGNLAEVPVWQAIALSLNVAPESLDAAPGGFDPCHCGNLPKEFNPRLRIVSSQLANLGIVRTAWDRYTPDYMLTVSLDCFGIWSDSQPYPWKLPDEFPPLEDETGAGDEQTNAAKSEPTEILKSAALVLEFSGAWPSIERDLRDKTRHANTLLNEANISHGHYDVKMALRWARTEGKISKDKATAYAKTSSNSVLSALIGQLYNLD